MGLLDMAAKELDSANTRKKTESIGNEYKPMGMFDPRRYSINDTNGVKFLPEGNDPKYKITTTDKETGEEVIGAVDFGQFHPTKQTPIPERPRNNPIYNALGSFGEGVNRGISSLAGLPVDAITGGLNAMGANIQKPVGGSQYIKEKLMPKEYPVQGAAGQYAQAIGEQVPGMLLPVGATAEIGKAALPALKASIPSAIGSGLGVGTARNLAPGSMTGEIAGAVLGGLAGGGVQTFTGARNLDIDRLIKKNLNTALRPSVSGKSVASDISKYEDKGVGVVKQIVQDARERNVPTPQSLEDFGVAIENLRGKVYAQFNDMSKQAGQEGVKVSLRNIGSELDEVITNKSIQDWAPDVIEFAKGQKAVLQKRGEYTPEEAERSIALLNKQLKAYYEGRSTGISEQKAIAMAGVATKLRSALDNSIESVAGPGYQKLKNSYGQLKALEKDVVKRTVVDSRKNPHGFFDLSDMFSTHSLVKGLLTASPATVAAGGAMLAVKKFLKLGNDPNKIVKTMFNKVDKFLPTKQKWAGIGERELGFEMQPHKTELVSEGSRSLVPTGKKPPVYDADYRDVTPLPPTYRAGLLDSPRNTTPIQAPWNPLNNPGQGPQFNIPMYSAQWQKQGGGISYLLQLRDDLLNKGISEDEVKSIIQGVINSMQK